MEDVVLHYLPGSGSRLASELEMAEKLLGAFPCRPPPAFAPWFSDSRLPIRPAQSAPVIAPFHISVSVSGGKENLVPPDLENSGASSHHGRRGCAGDARPSLRSWSVFTHRRAQLQRCTPLSGRFRRMVSTLKLHLRQRVRWVISKHNCAEDIEQVWRSVSRFIRAWQLPTCNANIQRERAEIWVFCDVVHSEQVGHFLKDKLQLFGKICLTVHRRGNILSI